MTDFGMLDRPIWSSLRSGWASLAEGDERALRLTPAYGPFGASADGAADNLASLRSLIPPKGELWLVEAGEASIPTGTQILRRGVLNQMVAETITSRRRDLEVLELDDRDAGEMLALAEMTKPGPFASLTHRLGYFVGVRQQGKLIAMAGERMRIGKYCEVSGVCTHPDHRGQGLAGTLMSIVAEKMVARGETPFLHSYAHNAGAIALYESLGFRYRNTIHLTVIGEA